MSSDASSSPALSRRVIDRRLDRARVLSEVRRGLRSRVSVSDASSALISSAEVLGEATDTLCPICQRAHLKQTRWIHGTWLGEKSGTARSVNEIQILIDDFATAKVAPDAEFSIHTVEVCLHCKWNFLTQHEVLTQRQ